MIRTGLFPLCLAASLALSPAARAQAQAPAAIEAAFEAADRGDLGPAERALAAASGDSAALLRARLAAARYDAGVARDPALARLAESRDPRLRDAALSILTSASFAAGDYRAAETWGRRLAQAQTARGDAEGAAETERAWRLAALLAGSPALSVEGAPGEGSTPARVDRVGLPRIDVAVNNIAQEAVFDTGANLSVLSAETARRLGLRLLDGASNVGNGVQGTVPIRVGIADRLTIAGATLRNVPFLIIDDAQLTFPVPGGYDIKAIVGLPAMRMLGRMRIEQAGRLVLLAPAEAQPAPPNMSASGNNVFVTVAVDGAEMPMHLDTGANKSSLSALYATAHPEAVAALERRTAGMASAGGARLASVATWPNAPLALAGRRLALPSLEIALPSAEGPAPRFVGVLGSDVLRAFDSYTLDFRAMRLELGAPVRADRGGAAAAGETGAPVPDQLPLVTFMVPGRRDPPIVLSETAVLSDERGNFVYIIDDNDTVVRRDVATGRVGARGVAIIRGLDGDERVVDRAGAFLNPGERVRPERARGDAD